MADSVETFEAVDVALPIVTTPNAERWRPPADVRLYLTLRRTVERLQAAIGVSFVGLSLGALTQRRRFAVDRHYYDRERMYHTARYNEQGLFDWERAALDQYFAGRESVVVACAGGGREVIALRRSGLSVAGFECHHELAAQANTLLQRLEVNAVVHIATRDECPALDSTFDGAIVGWGGYMLIRSRARRVRFLAGMRALLPADAPMLLSFMARSRSGRFRAAAKLGNLTRRILGGESVEIGDYLVPNYVHFFTREEITSELEEGGFALAFYSPTPYAHVVAHAT